MAGSTLPHFDAVSLFQCLNADIEAYDRGHAHMLMFADALTSGIVKQFPKKFVK